MFKKLLYAIMLLSANVYGMDIEKSDFFVSIRRCLNDVNILNNTLEKEKIWEAHRTCSWYTGYKHWDSLSECIADTRLFEDTTLNEIKNILECYSMMHYEKKGNEPQTRMPFENWKSDAQYFLSEGFIENMTTQKQLVLHMWINNIISGCFFCGCCHWPLEIMPEGESFTRQLLDLLKSKITLNKEVENRIDDLIFNFSLTESQRKSLYY